MYLTLELVKQQNLIVTIVLFMCSLYATYFSCLFIDKRERSGDREEFRVETNGGH